MPLFLRGRGGEVRLSNGYDVNGTIQERYVSGERLNQGCRLHVLYIPYRYSGGSSRHMIPALPVGSIGGRKHQSPSNTANKKSIVHQGQPQNYTELVQVREYRMDTHRQAELISDTCIIHLKTCITAGTKLLQDFSGEGQGMDTHTRTETYVTEVSNFFHDTPGSWYIAPFLPCTNLFCFFSCLLLYGRSPRCSGYLRMLLLIGRSRRFWWG